MLPSDLQVSKVLSVVEHRVVIGWPTNVAKTSLGALASETSEMSSRLPWLALVIADWASRSR